jgi:carboxyl-terminal processing protease
MINKYAKFSTCLFFVVIGIFIGLIFSANANRTNTSLPIDELRNFTEIFGKIKNDYVEDVTDKKLISEAIKGMRSGLDPHSAYLDEDAFKDLQVGTQGEFGGLGIEVGMEDGFVKVVSPIEDTPAWRAGLKSGDLIIKIDDTNVKGLTLGDAVKKMRGKPKTKIILTVVRQGESEPLVFTIIRDIIQIQSVKSEVLEDSVAYVRITQFQEKTGLKLAEALKKRFLEVDNNVDGIILDLRNDPGGLLNSAVAVTSAFIPENTLVVYTEGRVRNSSMKLFSRPEHYLRSGSKNYLADLPEKTKTVPMVVLINNGSASASEIVAGALQDHSRAVIMGTQSFGKGSVQTILPLNNGTAIKLTTARYFTPKGRSIQAKGITPDIVVSQATIQEDDESKFQVSEKDLSRALDTDKPSDNSEQSVDDSTNNVDNKPVQPNSIVNPNDYQLNQALNLIKALNITNKM